MTFLAPWYLLLGVAGAAVVVALHFLARRRPPVTPLPTARFIPERVARARALAVRPTDRLLLTARVLALLLGAAAFARPVWRGPRAPVARVVMLDVSRAVGSPSEGRDSAAHWLRADDALVLFDSAARVVRGSARDSLAVTLPSDARGSLSAGLLAAFRAAHDLHGRADSLDLVIVTPAVEEQWDAATDSIRALWRGRARLIRTAARSRTAGAHSIELLAAPDDPLRATISLLGSGRFDAPVRITRAVPSPADSLWARGAGRVLVHWPVATSGGAWSRRSRPDTIGAVTADETVVVASFARDASPPTDGRVVAWWADGEAAATERELGNGCVRAVAIPLPLAGDLPLRDGVRRLLAAMTQPCGGRVALRPAADSLVARLAGAGTLFAVGRDREETATRLPMLWLLTGAAVLVLLEPLVRRGSEDA